MGRLGLLPPVLCVARDRRRLEERLDRFEERLRLLERLDDRDDGMSYICSAENKFGTNSLRCKLCEPTMMIESATEQSPE